MHEIRIQRYSKNLLAKTVLYASIAYTFRLMHLSFVVQLFGFAIAALMFFVWVVSFVLTRIVFGQFSVPADSIRIKITTEGQASWESDDSTQTVYLEGERGWNAWLGMLKPRKFPGCDAVPTTPYYTIHNAVFSEQMPRRYLQHKLEQAFSVEFPKRPIFRWCTAGLILLTALVPFLYLHDMGFVIYLALFLVMAFHQVRCIHKSVLKTQWIPGDSKWQFEMYDGSTVSWSPKDTPRCPIGAPKLYGPFKGKAGRYSRFDWLLNKRLRSKLDFFRDELLFNYYSKKPEMSPEETKGWWP